MARARKNKPEHPTIDPELERQIHDAGTDRSVGATFTLRTPAGEPVPTARETEAAVARLLAQVQEEANELIERVRVFPNLQSFMVKAPPGVLRGLLARAEIASAMANEQREDLRIRPVRPDEHGPT